jgi:hypothetical protein
MRRRDIGSAAAALLARLSSGQEPRPLPKGNGPWVFAYFAHETAGLCLATSLDGLTWSVLNNGRPVMAKPFGPVFRDPSLHRGPNGTVQMVWTTAWKDRVTMGLASTRDLLRWERVREVPLMTHTPGTQNVWAPELFYDLARDRWIAHWSSSVSGRFSETRPPQPSWNNRIYWAESVDGLETFGPERVLFGPGFITNDGYLLECAGSPLGRYCLVVKRVFSTPAQHGAAARLYLTFGDKPEGPFRLSGEPITGDYEFCEGPTVARVGDFYHCYFELSKQGRMGCVRSRELKPGPWEDVTARLTLPAGVHHGGVLAMTPAEYASLNLRTDLVDVDEVRL